MQVVEEAGGHERDFRNVAMADVGFFEKWGQVIREKRKGVRKRGQEKILDNERFISGLQTDAAGTGIPHPDGNETQRVTGHGR
jgi:hypothetical protein